MKSPDDVVFVFDCDNNAARQRPRAERSRSYPPAATTIEHIGDLVGYDLQAFLGGGTVRRMG